jgi:sulfite exporter TauE/SafE
MAPLSPFDRARFRLGRIFAYLAVGIGLSAAAMSFQAGRASRAALPLATVALALWWLTLLSREDAA